MKTKEIFLTLIAIELICALAAGWAIDHFRQRPVEVRTEVKTVFRDRPLPVAHRILPDRYFFIPVETILTVTKNDTTYIQLPVEQNYYHERDEEHDVDVDVWVSGYRPALDSIRMQFPLTTISPPSPPLQKAPSRWSVGITTGPGLVMTPSGSIHGGWAITAGLQFRF